jgi:hypothetical protein
MKKMYSIVTCLFLMTPIICFGQLSLSLSTDYFISAATGDWSTSATWQSSHDNSTYFAATLAPTAVAAAIVIQNLHTVTISGSGVSLINTTVQSGGTLQLTTTATYTIADGPGNDLIIENGGVLLLNFTTITAPTINGTALIKTGGKVLANTVLNATDANAIGDYYLNINSKFTYQDKSIFEWNIAGFILPSTGAVNYFKTLLISDIPIFRISTAPIVAFGSSFDNVLNCILEVNAPLNIAGSGNKTFTGGLRGTSIINQTAGKILLPNATSLLDGSLTINTISSGLKLVNGAIVPVGANIKINVSAENYIIRKDGGNLQVNGTLDITKCRIENTGTGASVTIADGGILKTCNMGGFSGAGAAIVAEPIILQSNSTIEFNNAGNQNFNSRSDFKNLIFSGSGIKTPGNSFNPNGIVKITGDAVLDCTGHDVGNRSTNLTMDGGRLIVGTGGTQPAMGGAYNLTGGVVEFAGSTSKTIRTATYQNIEVTGKNVGNSSGNITLRDLGTFTIKNGADFTINSDNITGTTGTQTVTVENGGTFNCGNNQGFNGYTPTAGNFSSINPSIENIVLSPGSTVVYSRDGNQPITNANGLIYQNLTIAGTTGTKTAPSGTLNIQENFIKSGTSSFAHNNGTIVFSNTLGTQNYTCSSSIPVNFYNLTNNNTATGLNVINNMGIVNTLTLSGNSKINLTTGDITLLSNATNTARVAEVPATASITYGASAGRFIVERYYPNNNLLTGRGWRLVTTPLIETGTIFDTWQLSGAAYGAGNAHTGTLITGPQITGNGLDFTPTNNYSLKGYDGVNFTAIVNTKIPLSPAIGAGYFLFVRGDRNPILTNPANSDFTTLSSKGKLSTGTVNIDASNTYALVGNPYASPVNFAALGKSNVNPHRFWVWDPKINQVGAYVVMEDFNDPGIFTPTNIPISSQDNYIQSSQAFFVERELAGAASITFMEANKTANYNAAIFRPVSGQQPVNDFIRTNLHLLNADNTRSIADGAFAEFGPGYSYAVDMADALKFGNVNETFSLTTNNQRLAVERRPVITENDTLFYHLIHTTQRSYQVELVANISTPGLTAYWEDSYTQSPAVLNLLDTTLINFEVNTDPASAVANRFKIVFKKSSSPLPLTFSAIKASRQNNTIAVQWTVENEWNIAQYEIEKSVDGQHFTKVNTTEATGAANINFYSWADENPIPGDNFFRVKSIGQNGEEAYSRIVTVNFGMETAGMFVYPNPVAGNIISLHLVNQPKGVYYLRLLNNWGQVLQTKSIEHTGGSIVTTISPKAGRLATGTLVLEVINPDKISSNIKVLVEAK